MPKKVQNVKSAEKQHRDTARTAFDKEKGGTVYGDTTHSGDVTHSGAVVNAGNSSFPGDVITDIKVKKSTPAVRLTGSEGSAKDWRLVEDAGVVKLQENTGTEGTPTWTTRFSVNASGIASGELDSVAAALVTGRVSPASDFTSTSSTFVDVTGASITITTGAHRCRVNVQAFASNSSAGNYVALTLSIGGTDIESGEIMVVATSATGSATSNVSFTYLTPVLSAGSHTFKLRAKTSGAGTLTVYGAGHMQVEETLLTT